MKEYDEMKECFTVVHDWMIKELNLKGLELLIYATIYGISKIPNQLYTGGLGYLIWYTGSSRQGVVNALNNLVDKGYIHRYEKFENKVKFVNYKAEDPNNLGVVKKVDWGSSFCTGGGKETLPGVVKKVDPYNINNNNIDNNIYIKENTLTSIKEKRFLKPTLDDVKSYCSERENYVDPEKFYDYYESNGWKVGRNPMKDWKAAVRTWEKQGKKYDPHEVPDPNWG